MHFRVSHRRQRLRWVSVALVSAKDVFEDRSRYSYKCQDYEKIVESEPVSYYDPRIEACSYREGSKSEKEAIEDIDGDCRRVLRRIDIVRQRPVKKDRFWNAWHGYRMCIL